MSLFYVALIIISIFGVLFIIKTVNKSHFFISLAIEWIIIGVVVLLSAIFPEVIFKISKFAGFEVPYNFILFASTLFLAYQIFSLIVIVSKQQQQIKTLIQEISIMKKNMKDSEEN